jgi:FMN reductase
VSANAPRVVAVDGSPTGNGRTAEALRTVLAGTGAPDPDGTLQGLAGLSDAREITERVESADLIVLGSPVYRGSFSAPLKAWFDALPRGPRPADRNPLGGKTVAVVMTGGSWHHFLGQLDLVSMLTVTFAACVVPPGLYLTPQEFTADGQPDEAHDDLLRSYGARAWAMADALSDRPGWSQVRPQV